jgi:zinc transport system substrate-binding protein
MPVSRIARVAAALLLLAAFAMPAAATPPRVVVSIKPIHSLIAGVTAGVTEPDLIVAGAASPHTFTMKPSDARMLEHAEIVFWIGPIFESFLVKPLQALDGGAQVVELDRAPGVTLLPARAGGPWEPDADEPHPAAARTASALEQDGHLWLDPDNAKAIVRLAVAKLSALDKPNAQRYAANGAALERRLDALDAALRQRLAPLHGRPFVVFHDAYQYFDRRYGLDAIGSITVSPENPPSARRVAEIHDKVRTLNARCVFREPQFQSPLVDTVIADTGAHTDVLDPEGALLPRGPDLYFALLNGLADNLTRCLG